MCPLSETEQRTYVEKQGMECPLAECHGQVSAVEESITANYGGDQDISDRLFQEVVCHRCESVFLEMYVLAGVRIIEEAKP